MNMDYTFVVQSFVALFLIVDPIANVPIFISLLERFKESERRLMIKKSVIVATIVLLVFTLMGNLIFQFLGIGMYSFRIAGGLLLLIISIEMLFGRKSRTETTSEELTLKEREDITITPLAVPLLTGPGAITAGIVLFNLAKTPLMTLMLIVDILLVFLISYVILINSDFLYRIFGETGTRVITRIMGLLLSAIAVQFMITGISEAIRELSIMV